VVATNPQLGTPGSGRTTTSAIPRDMACVRGKVVSGRADFGLWIERLSSFYEQKTGMRFYPSTLNVELPSPYSLLRDVIRLSALSHGRMERCLTTERESMEGAAAHPGVGKFSVHTAALPEMVTRATYGRRSMPEARHEGHCQTTAFRLTLPFFCTLIVV
jgi:hypothetical protein